MQEVWKEVSDKGISFLVSNLGNVMSSPKKSEFVRFGKRAESSHKSRLLSKSVTRGGYYEISSQLNGVRKKFSIHRLVGMAFVDGYEKGLSINHKDGNKLNNLPENLEWVSLRDNTIHQWATGLTANFGENHPASKLTVSQVVAIRKAIESGVTLSLISEIAGVSCRAIQKIRDGASWVRT